MRKEILELLKAKFEGVSDTILGRIATSLAKTAAGSEAAKAAVEAMTLQQVIERYGDSRATEAEQSAISRYEEKHGLKDGEKVGNGGKPSDQNHSEPAGKGDDDDDTPSWAKKILDNQQNLEKRITAMEGDKVATTRKQKLEAIIGKLPEELRKPYARTSYKELSDEDFETLTNDISTEVEGLLKKENARGAVFGRPVSHNAGKSAANSGSHEASDKDAQRIVDGMKF